LLQARTDGDETVPREVVAEIVQELRLVDLDSQRARTVPAWAVFIPSGRLCRLGGETRSTGTTTRQTSLGCAGASASAQPQSLSTREESRAAGCGKRPRRSTCPPGPSSREASKAEDRVEFDRVRCDPGPGARRRFLRRSPGRLLEIGDEAGWLLRQPGALSELPSSPW
jgi:hypothetical protein